MSSGKLVDQESWWWNKEVQECLQRRRLVKKKWDTEKTEDSRQEYREMQRKMETEVAKTKEEADEDV